MSAIRTLVVDDEELARRRICSLLEQRADVEIVGRCETGEQAVRAIVEKRPDVVFLDVRMPDMDGFAVLEHVGLDQAPVVVFVTAFDDYAVRAFDVHAVDYLLKPFEDERFTRAFERACAECRRDDEGRLRRRLRALLDSSEVQKPDLERFASRRFVIRTGGRTAFLSQDEVDWVEASGSYVRLHAAEQDYLLRETMAHIEQRLDRERFLRVHRSQIVNLERVQSVLHGLRGAITLVLPGEVRIQVSEKYRASLRKRLGI